MYWHWLIRALNEAGQTLTGTTRFFLVAKSVSEEFYHRQNISGK
jgi:hypothetical protein